MADREIGTGPRPHDEHPLSGLWIQELQRLTPLTVEAPAGGMQLLARCRPHTDDQQLATRLLEAGVVSRALTRMLYHRSTERGLFLGFAAWNEKEIDRAAHILGRIMPRAS